jgi:hypothetical protein
MDAASNQPVIAEEGTVHIRFVIPLSVCFGDELVLCGSSEQLGAWDVQRAPKFKWGAGDVWVLDAELPQESVSEFKVVHVLSNGEHIWEYTGNRTIIVPSSGTMRDGEVTLTWCDEYANVAEPKILSSLASWDEDISSENGSNGVFDSVIGLLTGTDSAVANVIIDPSEGEDQTGGYEPPKEDDVSNNEYKDLDTIGDTVEEEVIAAIDEEPPVKHEQQTVTASSTSNKTKQSATSTALKNVTTAGALLAGIGGAAALAGIAVDAAIIDTAMMGLAVVAGGAALSTPEGSNVKSKRAKPVNDDEKAEIGGEVEQEEQEEVEQEEVEQEEVEQEEVEQEE